ncbi:MAG: SecY-interacting protein [Enterobacteriaceae bacterium]
MNSATIATALHHFTAAYSALWQRQWGHLPASESLFGIASPCIVSTEGEAVLWQPQPMPAGATLEAVGRAVDLQLHPDIEVFYTTQYAGDLHGLYQGEPLTLLQAWSAEDFVRLQENLIGHLLTQRRLKLSPTLFLATTSDDTRVISLCNLTGQVLNERLGSRERSQLSDTLACFLTSLQPLCNRVY